MFQAAFEHPDHLCNGLCPDDPEPGMDSRDPDCFYCSVMILADALDKGRRFERAYQESLGATTTQAQWDRLDSLQSAFLDAYLTAQAEKGAWTC
jgi:hypothetical protein